MYEYLKNIKVVEDEKKFKYINNPDNPSVLIRTTLNNIIIE